MAWKDSDLATLKMRASVDPNNLKKSILHEYILEIFLKNH